MFLTSIRVILSHIFEKGDWGWGLGQEELNAKEGEALPFTVDIFFAFMATAFKEISFLFTIHILLILFSYFFSRKFPSKGIEDIPHKPTKPPPPGAQERGGGGLNFQIFEGKKKVVGNDQI